jgi:hypothetical protein
LLPGIARKEKKQQGFDLVYLFPNVSKDLKGWSFLSLSIVPIWKEIVLFK